MYRVLICIKLFVSQSIPSSLLWRHNGRDGVTNHQPHDCLLNRLFMRRSKETSKLRVTGLCVRNSPVTGEFPAQRAVTRKMFPFDDVIMRPTLHRYIFIYHAVLKFGQFGMPWTCENWLGLSNSCVDYTRQTRKICQVLPCSVDFKAPGELWKSTE